MNTIAAKLSKDHEQLDALLEQLAQDAQACDRDALQATWGMLESRLIRHLEAEERYLLPLVDAQCPAEVAVTRLEHAQIRDSLCELGVAVEPHTIRETDVRKLIDLLQAHARREEVALYPVAGEKASVAVEHSISAAIKAAVRSALHATGGAAPLAGSNGGPARP
jgi:hemerythrin superfamily protein